MGIIEGIQLELRKFVSPEYIFGIDARLTVANYCKQLGGKKVLLVTDSGLMKTPWFSEITTLLQNSDINYVVFSAVTPNPRDFEVMQGSAVYQDTNCNLIVALGGGSVLDCAKGIGIVSTNSNHIRSFEGVDKIKRPMPPLICIPTTSGTAADVSQFAIINNVDEHYKMAIISKTVVPDVALIDPVVLTTMDKSLTAFTGMDALTHAFEAYVSNASSPFTDLYALESIKLISNNLHLSVEKPDDLNARGNMMLASLYAGLAFSNASLGCVHSMAHSLGGFLDLPHGECNAILLPHVVDYNYNIAAERYTKIASALNLETSGLSTPQVKKIIIDYLFDLKKTLGISTALREKHVSICDVPVLSTKAIKDPCNATNPRPPVKADLETIYKEAL